MSYIRYYTSHWRLTFLAVLVFSASIALPARAQPAATPAPDAAATAQTVAQSIAPHWRAEDSLVVNLDLARLDLNRLYEHVQASAAALGEQALTLPLEAVRDADRLRAELVQRGARRALVLMSMSRLAQHRLTVALMAEGPEQAAAVADTLRRNAAASLADDGAATLKLPPHVAQTWPITVDGSMVLWGADPSLPPSPSDAGRVARLAAAFESVSEGVIQVVVMPDNERVVISEFDPPLPPELGVSGRELGELVHWIAASLNYDQPQQVRVVVNTPSDAGAQRLSTLINTVALHASSKLPEEASKMWARVVPRLLPKPDGARLVSQLDAADHDTTDLLAKLLIELARPARRAAQDSQTINNLKQLALSHLLFESSYGSLPPSASYDKQGRPLLSWRVFVLPFLEEGDLYKQFHLDEPWDSEHNRQLIPKMPEVFRSPHDPDEVGKTRYLVPFGPNLGFEGQVGRRISDIKDGTSKTILVVEVAPDRAVVWTQPSDWEVDMQRPAEGLRRPDGSPVAAARMDGSVHRMDLNQVTDETLRRLLQINDGQPVDE